MRLLGIAVLFIGLVAGACSGEAESASGQTTTTKASVPVADEPTGVAEAPWVAHGEIRIGSSVITVASKALDAGSFTLVYDVTSLAPTRTVMHAEGVQLSPPVLPERWVLETTSGPVEATSSLTSDSVRFPLDSEIAFDDLISLRLESWRTIVPITYDMMVSTEISVPEHLPDDSAIQVSRTYTTEDEILVTLDVTPPVDNPKVVPCGDANALGSSCYDPVPATGWSPRVSDADLQIAARAGTPSDVVPLRYQRPMWIHHEGSKVLELNPSGDDTGTEGDFPVGFVPIDENEAIAPSGITWYGDQLLVSMLSATRRGVDPGSFDPLMGGRWILETTSGEPLESLGMAYNDRVPGAFSVIFPNRDTEGVYPLQIRLVERWLPVHTTGAADSGQVDGLTGSLPSPPLTIDLDEGPQIEVERFERVGVGGYGIWATTGSPAWPVVAEVSGSIIGPSGTPIVTTEPMSTPARHFGLANTGRLFWFWIPDSGEDLDTLQGDLHLRIQVDAYIPTPEPADIVIDLTGLMDP